MDADCPFPAAPSSLSFAQEIEGREVAEIRVEGNKEVPTESILMVMDTKPGMPLSMARLRSDLRAIYDMGFFAQEPVALPMLTPEGRIILVVRVFENPVVKDIVFKGKHRYPVGEIEGSDANPTWQNLEPSRPSPRLAAHPRPLHRQRLPCPTPRS
jgi:outer membrane protein assembly factor BamA